MQHPRFKLGSVSHNGPMEQSIRLWIIGGFSIVFLLASVVFNALLVSGFSNAVELSALRTLLFVSVGLGVVSLISLLYLNIVPIRQLRAASLGLSRTAWWAFVYVTAVSSSSLALTGVVLVWSVLEQDRLPTDVIVQEPIILIAVWFGCWGVTLILQVAFHTLLGIWLRKALKKQSLGRLDLDFGIRPMPLDEVRPESQMTQQTFRSQDITLNSPPRTPVSHHPSTRRSSSTRVGTISSSKIKLVKGSAKSSLDLPAWPAGEAVSIDSAFDMWDTSSVHREMRDAVHSSPTYRRGLETIPGSRSESPANALEGPFLPSSPHAASSNTAEMTWNTSSPYRQYPSSPPSSPPNFSRPTSRPSSSHKNKALAPAFELVSPTKRRNSGQENIHPLFRQNSPEPPPVAGAGTSIVASPMAGQPMTPKTLSRLRSRSESTGHWRAMPSIDHSDRPSTSGSVMSSLHGSPGPSIIDDEEPPHPQILPAFILGAGQRSSLVGYGRRKSRPKSQISAGSRLSHLLT